MKMLIVGAGATGGFFGGLLAAAGRDVTFLVRDKRAAQLARDGLVIRSPHGDVQTPVKTVVARDLNRTFDTALVTVKAFGLDGAIADFAPAVGPDTTIVPILNGIKHIDTLVQRFGAARVVGGVCRVASTLDEEGRIHQLAGFQELLYGELDGAPSQRIEALHAFMSGARFDAKISRDIVQDLLGFARRGDTTDRQIVDLRDVIRQALKISELQTRSQGIVVNTTLPENALILEAQPNQLSQALCNILQNSAEAILEKRRDDPRARGEISVALRSTGDLYELLIGDTGVGIKPEVQDKVFNPLFTTKASNANSGLGLTMAFKIIAEHAGRLELSSQPGVGTTAKIAFHRPDKSPESPTF